ncbi:hypothetical protein F4678DRAFT_466109 [Xylaria arbuscula]|nr:hypothetical protein F4678DRAFT_466109 [Xylaria arbuscula]
MPASDDKEFYTFLDSIAETKDAVAQNKHIKEAQFAEDSTEPDEEQTKAIRREVEASRHHSTNDKAHGTTHRFDVSITAGNEKLAKPTGKCSAASNINTRAVALWGFLGAVGAIGIMTL